MQKDQFFVLFLPLANGTTPLFRLPAVQWTLRSGTVTCDTAYVVIWPAALTRQDGGAYHLPTIHDSHLLR